jgi:hypothetical protein
MRMKLIAVAAAALSLGSATAVQAWDNQYAALAIDHNGGSAYGWAVNHYTQVQADRAALSQCGKGCRIVLRFYRGCGAYAVAGNDNSIYGWGKAADGATAKSRALAEVSARGGRNNVVRVWGCNGA